MEEEKPEVIYTFKYLESLAVIGKFKDGKWHYFCKGDLDGGSCDTEYDAFVNVVYSINKEVASKHQSIASYYMWKVRQPIKYRHIEPGGTRLYKLKELFLDSCFDLKELVMGTVDSFIKIIKGED